MCGINSMKTNIHPLQSTSSTALHHHNNFSATLSTHYTRYNDNYDDDDDKWMSQRLFGVHWQCYSVYSIHFHTVQTFSQLKINHFRQPCTSPHIMRHIVRMFCHHLIVILIIIIRRILHSYYSFLRVHSRHFYVNSVSPCVCIRRAEEKRGRTAR